jgi:hypothetical protein
MATVISFAMFGALFAMPQDFQAIGGASALSSGLRLLPIIGGLMVGSSVANKLASRAGANVTTALGFALLAASLLYGATTGVHTTYGPTGVWLGTAGLGMGLVFPTAMNAALGKLSAERSGVGSSLIQALRQVGATIGVAILGTVLASAYRSQLDLTGLPAQAADAVRKNVLGGIAVADAMHSQQLLNSVKTAFVHGLDVMLVVSAGIAIASVVLALVFMPRRVPAARKGTEPEFAEQMSPAGN